MLSHHIWSKKGYLWEQMEQMRASFRTKVGLEKGSQSVHTVILILTVTKCVNADLCCEKGRHIA